MSEQEIKTKLIPLYQAIADLTKPECAKCLFPYHCCDPQVCKNVIDNAEREWGVSLPVTNHPRLPLMGPTGCTAAPHLRPCCSVHTCEVEKWAYKEGDDEWNRKYWELRDQINELEMEWFLINKDV